MFPSIRIVVAAVLALAGSAQAATVAGTIGTAIPGVAAAGTQIELIKEGFNGTEGPVGLPDGSLLFTETTANRITRIAADGSTSSWLENSNGANGLGFDPSGALVAVQVLETRVGIVAPAERARTLASGWEGLPFGRPNDVVVGKSGNVYFTDSGVNGAPPAHPVARPAVYRISPAGKLERVAADIERPNGIQLSPDEKTLYVALDEIGRAHV